MSYPYLLKLTCFASRFSGSQIQEFLCCQAGATAQPLPSVDDVWTLTGSNCSLWSKASCKTTSAVGGTAIGVDINALSASKVCGTFNTRDVDSTAGMRSQKGKQSQTSNGTCKEPRFYKTKLCKYADTGGCPRGSRSVKASVPWDMVVTGLSEIVCT